jgi:hypothetical protein
MGTQSFLATTGAGIARAVDDGHGHWRVDHLLEEHHVRCLAVDPLQPGVVYAGTSGSGVMRSADSGHKWDPAGLTGHDVRAIAVSAAQPGLVYAGTRPALLHRSLDGGANWDELRGFRDIPHRRWWFSPAEKPFTAYVQSIAPSPTDPGVIVVGIEAGATVRSVNGGETWSRHLRGALRDCHSLAFHPTDGAWVYEAGGSGAGVAWSRDRGETWSQPRTGLDRHYGWACAPDAFDPTVWYASVSPGPLKAHREGHAEAALFRMAQGTWERLSGGLPHPIPSMPYSVISDVEVRGLLYAGMADGTIWQSPDHGETWTKLPVDMGAVQRVIVRI